MYLKDLGKNWDRLGKEDPFWAIATDPKKRNGGWDVEEFFKTGVKEIADIMQYIDKIHINIKKRKVLDFGCGAGRLTQALAQYFDEVVGVDISPSMISLANEYNVHKNNCEYRLNTASDLKLFNDNYFDFIYSNIVLQHIPPKYSEKYIKEFLRILVPGGLLIFQLPSKRLPGKSIKALLRRIVPIPNSWVYMCKRKIFGTVIEMHCIEQKDILNLLKNNNAVVIDVVNYNAAEFLSCRYCVAKK
ncbi:MAG: hypothetical protein A2Y13_08520 [Planctomycetes bacterium GWC2_45_44]|nr:MAG: hypothetical protein A2Y13_08520 [Planctomycetes bacterium GWC2_45_44]